MKNLLKNIAFSMIIIIAFFAGLEVCARLYMGLKIKDPFVYFRFKTAHGIKAVTGFAKKKEIRIDLPRGGKKGCYNIGKTRLDYAVNRLLSRRMECVDFRGKEFLPHDRKGKIRVCVFGGSAVWGAAVNPPKTISSYLQQDLDGGFEVLNCGFPGYMAEQIYSLLKNEIIYYNPDIIVVYSGFNDAYHPTYKNYIHDFLYYKWILYTYLIEKYHATRERSSGGSVIPGEYKKFLGKIVWLAKENGIEVVLAKELLHNFTDGVYRSDGTKVLEEKYAATVAEDQLKRQIIKHYYYNLQAEEVALRNGLVIVDTIREMEKNPKFFADQVHLTPAGDEEMAKFIARAILAGKE